MSLGSGLRALGGAIDQTTRQANAEAQGLIREAERAQRDLEKEVKEAERAAKTYAKESVGVPSQYGGASNKELIDEIADNARRIRELEDEVHELRGQMMNIQSQLSMVVADNMDGFKSTRQLANESMGPLNYIPGMF